MNKLVADIFGNEPLDPSLLAKEDSQVIEEACKLLCTEEYFPQIIEMLHSMPSRLETVIQACAQESSSFRRLFLISISPFILPHLFLPKDSDMAGMMRIIMSIYRLELSIRPNLLGYRWPNVKANSIYHQCHVR
jgi:hypothetical protein